MSFPQNVLRWKSLAEEESAKFQINPRIVMAVIEQESGGRDHAVSSAGAVGLMQLMPDTARDMGQLSDENLLTPQVNVRLGVKYLSYLGNRISMPNLGLSREEPAELLHTQLVLAAYNGGIGNLCRKYRGIPPFTETFLYILKITKRLKKEGPPWHLFGTFIA